MQTRFEGFKTQLASQMMPVLNSLLSSFLQGAEDGGQFGSVIQSVGVIAKGVAVGIIGLASAIQVVIRLIQGFVEQAKILVRQLLMFGMLMELLLKGKL